MIVTVGTWYTQLNAYTDLNNMIVYCVGYISSADNWKLLLLREGTIYNSIRIKKIRLVLWGILWLWPSTRHTQRTLSRVMWGSWGNSVSWSTLWTLWLHSYTLGLCPLHPRRNQSTAWLGQLSPGLERRQWEWSVWWRRPCPTSCLQSVALLWRRRTLRCRHRQPSSATKRHIFLLKDLIKFGFASPACRMVCLFVYMCC